VHAVATIGERGVGRGSGWSHSEAEWAARWWIATRRGGMGSTTHDGCTHGEIDEDISVIRASSSDNHSPSNMNIINSGPLIRSRTKKLQEQVNSFLTDLNSNTCENVILPKNATLVVLRKIREEEEESDHQLEPDHRPPARTPPTTSLDQTTDHQLGSVQRDGTSRKNRP
jgi:hypothetical protein